jgi:signal transduction histidine kinase
MNPFKDCKKYGIPLWQCPSFLFFLMGVIITFVSLTIYFVGTKYIQTPEIVALIVLLTSAILFVISWSISNSFEKLAQANILKSEFIRVLTHQLGSPLSNIRWSLELISSGKIGKISEKQLEHIQILRGNLNRMRQLVKDLLTISKLETPTFEFKKEKFSFSDLVKEVIKEFKILAEAYNVEIKTFFQENLPQIFGFKEQIKLAVENLLDNAIKYTKRKGLVEIKIQKKRKMIYFEIKDNGIGIPKEDQKFIFQSFYRASNVVKYQPQGTGLGLYIVQKTIQRSKGKIGFKSEENKGSTFWFYLPIK